MIRAFHSSVAGMRAQQKSIDLISNNIANVNTNGFRAKRADFKDLLYSDMELRNIADPPNLQVGNGVRLGATVTSVVQGALIETSRPLDVALDERGFLTVAGLDGSLRYTRDGGLNLSIQGTGADATTRIVNDEGFFVLADDGRPVEFAPGLNAANLRISTDGTIVAPDANGNEVFVARLGIVEFANPAALNAEGNNLFSQSEASGEALPFAGAVVRQSFLEASNVDMANEMTRLLMAQRAYQLSARVLQTADDMESMANNLRR